MRTIALLAACLFLSTSPAFADFVTLHAMSEADGSRAHELVLASDGNFYGVTLFGGAHDLGTAFRMSPDGTFTVIADFDGTNGAIPEGGLTIAKDGSLYGTTYRGGAFDAGTFFRIQPGGALVTLASFDPSTGLAHPNSTMRTAADQNLYGTTDTEDGLIFSASLDGTLTRFSGIAGAPQNLMMADGIFYGTTLSGGLNQTASVFNLFWPSGSTSTVYSFNNVAPGGDLLYSSDGDFYGTVNTTDGRCCGAIFRISEEGFYTVIATFKGPNGSYPQSGLVEGPDGSFYGTTAAGGASNDGTIFRVTPDGQLTTVMSFDRATTGSWLAFDLALESDGHIYGSTLLGGEYDNGTIFRADAVTVSAAPDVHIQVSPTTIALGQSATVTWSARDSAACKGSPDWSAGYIPSSGTMTVTPTRSGNLFFGLDCRNVKGSVSTGAQIMVKNWSPAWVSPTPQEGSIVDATVAIPFAQVIQGSVSDGDHLSFGATTMPSGMSIVDRTSYPPQAKLTWTPAQAGIYDVVVTATDDVNQVINRNFKVRVNKRATAMTAHAEILDTAPVAVHLKMKAVLDVTYPGFADQALAGKSVTFSAPDGAVLCSAVTDNTGTASCGTPTTYLRTTINRGYKATFAGDDSYLGSSASAPLMQWP